MQTMQQSRDMAAIAKAIWMLSSFNEYDYEDSLTCNTGFLYGFCIFVTIV